MTDSVVQMSTTHDGLEQLRRHWAAATPRAAMLLVHGLGEHSGRYEHVGRAFADAGIDTLGFDNRGFGRSGGRRAHVSSFDEYLADIEVLLDERRRLGVPVVLMGHSLGGLMSTAYLVGDRRQPDLAVLSAPALQADIPRWQRIAAPVLGRLLPRFHVRSEFDGSILSRDTAVQQAYDTDPLRVDGSTAGMGLQVMSAMTATSAALDRISVPTYVLHGDADALVPPVASEAIGRRPGVTRRVWPGLRHECLNEPEHPEVIAEIVAWLDSQL